MQHSIRRTTKRALLLVKAGAVVTVVALGLGFAAPTPTAPPAAGPTALSAELPSADQRMLARHDCSQAGLSAAEQPRSAVIRSGSGKLRIVDFETGWAIYTRHGEETLVAICLADPPA